MLYGSLKKQDREKRTTNWILFWGGLFSREWVFGGDMLFGFESQIWEVSVFGVFEAWFLGKFGVALVCRLSV